MTESIKKTAEWKTTSGLKVTVTAELKLKKTVNLDGHKCEHDCCDKSLNVEIEGHGSQGGWVQKKSTPVKFNGLVVVAQVGKLGLTQGQVDIIADIEKEIESAPEWVAKQAKIEKNQKEIREMEASRKANGYCEKCGSYCYGDCESN